MPFSLKNRTKNSSHFRAFFEYATMCIVVTDSNGNINAINPFALNEFGYAEAELAGREMEVLVPNRFRNNLHQYRKKYLDQPQNRSMDPDLNLYARRKDGSEFAIELSMSMYEIEGEQFLISFINNVSVRKRAEAEIIKLQNQLEYNVEKRTVDLRNTMKQLEKAVAFQNAILYNAGVMIITVDSQGIIQSFNPEAEYELGYKADELVGKYSILIFHDPFEISKRAIELEKELLQTVDAGIDILFKKALLGMHDDFECNYICKNGKRLPVLLNMTALRDERNNVFGFLGIAINISERKKAEENLLESLKKEKELNELKSRFVTMASHEFRTPLSTVLSSAYLIEKYPATNDQAKREIHLQRIVSSVNMLSDILNDFLSLGKIEEGKIQVRLSRFNIRELIEEIITEVKDNLQPNQEVNYHHEGEPDIILDPSLLKHIVMNLVSNAGKFSPEGKPIIIKTIHKDHQIMLSVKDQGIGISREDQQHLMERFFRGANAVNIKGTGLGLHIVSKYAELLNGIVKFKSELERGTEFIITFKI